MYKSRRVTHYKKRKYVAKRFTKRRKPTKRRISSRQSGG